MKNEKKEFIIMLDGRQVGVSWAVSIEKAINNFRYQMFCEKGNWFGIPSIDDFDAVEL